MSKVQYYPPEGAEQGCGNCNHTTCHDALCLHRPLPEGLGEEDETDVGGTCDYWERKP